MVDGALSRRRMLVTGAAAAAGLMSAACSAAQGSSPAQSTSARTSASAAVRTAPRQSPIDPARPAAVVAAHAGQRPGGWGMDLPGILTSIPADGKQMALTFDACGGPDNNELNEELLNFLMSQEIPATLFLNKRWIEADPVRASRLAANPLFELGNHGTRHCPLSVNGRAAYGIPGTGSAQEAVDEVWANHEVLTRLVGRQPRFFRTGTAHYDDVGVAIVRDLGERPVGFSINADAGATYTAAQVRQAMSEAKPGVISIAHMHRPKSGTAPGMIAMLPKLRAQGFQFVKLP
ncbi:polysaccharide deacetylase family protein [Nocardia terpenica]|uniref:polysaccharide deacetylase family protein n=1 Tax=Nocardia terpenica TaxID=455432 RepID=UPI002B4B610E|nr:polysaccharide deacetylase family protein [Nocardia terpenica]